MPRVSRKKRVLQTINTTVHGLQILDLIFDDTDPFAEDLSVIHHRLQQKRYWTLRQNPETPLNTLHRWFDSLYHRDNSRKFRSLFRMMPEHFRGLCRLIVAIVVFISGGFVVLILHLLTLININW